MEAESSPSACTFLEPRIKPEAVIPDTFSSRTDTSYTSTQDEPSSGAFQVEPHTKSSIDPCSSSLASGGSTNQQNELSVTVGGQCHNHIFTPLSSLKSVKETPASPELTQSVSGLNPDDIVHSRTNVAYDELQQRQCRENGIETTQYDHKETSPWRASEDGYNWRKYGQKHIKGSEFPRSYYKCSYSNCHAKKQVERSQNGRVTDVVYKGQHDHAKPQINSQMSGGTVPLIHEERSNGVSFSCNFEDISSNGHHQPSPRARPNVAPELPPSDNNMEDAGEKLSRLRDRVENEDHPESKRRRIMSNLDSSEFPSNRLFDPSEQEGEEKSENIVSTNSIANVDEAVSKNELILSVTVRDPSVDMITSRSIVPFGADSDDVGQRSGKYLQAVRSDQKGSTRFVTSERLLGDGYNWRKYGQKHIKGSEFPRSYYRCTHPNCQVKKQLERSHDRQITEIIYKGEHDHPKPHLSSHMPIARFLSVQDEGSDRISSLNCTEDKSSNGNSQITQRLELNGTSELSPTVTSVNNVQGEGSQSQWTNSMAENDDSESKCRCLKFSKESGNAGRDSNHKQADTSVEVEVRFQSESLVSSPSPKNMDANSHELTPPITILPPPFYMVTSRGIVPVEVGSNELRQTQGSDSGALALQADQNGVSMEVTERLLENAYHWRKYGQKNIKGSPFPRSYYRCTHPSCQVKMQLEKSHDGRIIEVMCKGKHDHPKPQPINRMAIGAILSLEDERPDRSSINSIGGGTEEKPSNGNAQTSLEAQQICSPEFSPFSPSDDDVECAGVKSNKNHHEVEDGKDSEFKYRKDTGDVAEFIQAVRAPKEPRFVVETLSEYDVVDDGYRWQKYGRKMVKGNPYPRNYYRCSATACPVKKHVERSSHNSKALVTTYEGKHNHDLPPRPTGQELVQKLDSSDMFVTSSDLDNVSMDVEPQKSQSDDVDPDCSKAIATNLVSAHDGHLVENADQDKSRNEQSGSFSPDAPSLSHSSNLKEQKMEIQ